MTYTTRTASQAVARARLYSTYQQGMCLNFVWNALDAPQRIYCGSAIESWSKATRRLTTGVPPAGAPIYFRGGSYGHIALSLGGGWMRTTDWRTGYGSWKGSVGNCTINDLCREWYGTTANYLGWSRDYAGQIISGLEATSSVNSGTPPPLTSTPTTPAGSLTMSDVSDILAAIKNLSDAEAGRYVVDTGRYGDLKSRLDSIANVTGAIRSEEANRYADEQGDLGRIEDVATQARSEATARYADFVARFNTVLAAESSDSAKLDELKTLIDALPKAPAV